ncbi:MAG: CRISPR-associated protein Cas4, partial [Bacilli bacterium]
QEAMTEETIKMDGRDGYWSVAPIEYKRGKPKSDDRDAVQLCAQAICLEEMMKLTIPKGAIYYAEIRRRDVIEFTTVLRERVQDLVILMRQFFDEGFTPRAEYKKHCVQCSLITKCKPKWSSKGSKSAAAYVKKWLEGGDER